MRKEDKKKLSIHRRIIVNHLQDLEGILDYLISKEVFTPAIRERVIYVSFKLQYNPKLLRRTFSPGILLLIRKTNRSYKQRIKSVSF